MPNTPPTLSEEEKYNLDQFIREVCEGSGNEQFINEGYGFYDELSFFIAASNERARVAEREKIIDTLIRISSKYWIDKNVGQSFPLVVNKHQFKKFVLYELEESNA